MKSIRYPFLDLKKLSIIGAILLSHVISANGHSREYQRVAAQWPDVDTSEYIFFASGHHGYIWSRIVREANDISIFHGVTGRQNDYVEKSTYQLSDSEKQLIYWAFDSLPAHRDNLRPKESVYSPINTAWEILRNEEQLFLKDQRQDYAGPDSVETNKKIQQIEYLMYYISSPALQQYLPEPRFTLEEF